MDDELFITQLNVLGREGLEAAAGASDSRFVLASFITWLDLRPRPRVEPLLWQDPVVALVTHYDCTRLVIGELRFTDPPLEPTFGDYYRFLVGSSAEYYLRQGTPEIHSYSFSHTHPIDLGISSHIFLTWLLLYAEYLSRLAGDLSCKHRQDLASVYRERAQALCGSPALLDLFS